MAPPVFNLAPYFVNVLVSSLVVALVYFYLYVQDRRRFLGLWFGSWVVYVLRVAVQAWGWLDPSLAGGMETLAHGLNLLNGLLLLAGAQDLLRRRLNPAWLLAALGVWLASLALIEAGEPAPVHALLPSLLVGGLTIYTGLVLLRAGQLSGTGRYLCGAGFIGWALLRGAYPLAAGSPVLMAGGYLLVSMVIVVLAVGTLMVYFQLARAEVEEREARLASIFSSASLGIALLDGQGRWLQVNQRLADLLGGTPADFTGGLFLARVHPKESEQCRARFNLQPGEPPAGWQVQARLQRVDGWYFCAALSAAPVHLDGGAPLPPGMGNDAQAAWVLMVSDISQQRSSQAALLESEERFRALFDQAPLAYMAVDKEGVLLAVNQAWLDLLGYRRDEVIGRWLGDFVPAGQRADFLALFTRLQAAGTPGEIELELVRKDGTPLSAAVTGRTSRGESSASRRVHFILRDITRQKQAEQALQAKTRQQERLVAAARTLAESLDLNEVLGRISSAALEMLHAPACTLYRLETDGRTLTPLLSLGERYPEEIMASRLDIDHCLTGRTIRQGRGMIFNQAASHPGGFQVPGTPVEADECLIVAPLITESLAVGAMCLERWGEPFVAEELALLETLAAYAAAALRNAQAVQLLQQEVNERRLAQEALQQSEARYLRLLDDSPISLWLEDLSGVKRYLDRLQAQGVGDFVEFFATHPAELQECVLQGRVQYVNRATVELYRAADAGQLLGSLEKILTPQGYQSHLHSLQAISENRLSFDMETTNCTLDGQVLDIALRWSVSPAGQDRYSQVVINILDITEQKRFERALSESEARYRSLFEANTSVMVLADPLSGELVDANPAACAYYGYSHAELTALRIWDLGAIAPDLAAEDLHKASTGERRYFVLKNRLASGELRDVELYCGPLTLKGRQLIYSIVHDITERKRREREMRVIQNVSAALRKAETRAEMVPIILQQIKRLLHASSAAMARRLASGEALIELVLGVGSELTGQRLPAGEGLIAQAFASGEPFTCTDVRHEPRFAMPGFFAEKTAVVVVPLVTPSEVIGALWVSRPADFNADDLKLLVAVSEMTANAVQRATLHEETQRRLHRLEALHRLDEAIAANLGIGLTLKVALEQVILQLEVDAADILLFEASTQSLVYASGHGLPVLSRLPGRLRLGSSLAGHAALDHHLLIVRDLAEGPPAWDPGGEIKKFTDKLRAEGFRAYAGAPLVARGQVKGVLELFQRRPLEPADEWLYFLDTLARQIAIAIDNASLFEDLQRSNMDLTLAYDTTLEGWARALELRDKETEGHSQRVTDLTLQLACALGMDGDALVHLRRGALLHDIGKMGIPDSILLKPGPLTSEEWGLMSLHPILAYELLSSIPFLRPALDVPYYHHEHWNGNGYPHGLIGEQIPLAARIFAVVDVWDALTSDRPYRAAWDKKRVLEYLRAQSGKQFDPRVLEAFLEIISNE